MDKLKVLSLAAAVASAVSVPSVMASEDGFSFNGYARYGAHFTEEDNRYVEGIGSTGRAVGRLGNEVNGGEFQLSRKFKNGESGANWDLVVMIDHWRHSTWGPEKEVPGGVDLKKIYAGVSNVVDSQPDLYLWAGRDFHQRPQQGINDYFWMMHDGQGGGFKNLTLGGAKLDMSLIAKIASGTSGTFGNDSGIYAVTSKLHGIDMGIGALDLYANYGFSSKEAGAALEDETSWQVGATLGLGSSNKLIARYTDGADASAFDRKGDYQTIYTSLEGNYNNGQPFSVEYLGSYKKISGDDSEKRDEFSGIVRPMYQWNADHSTWFEAGYAMEDYESGSEQKAWKTTISQNVSMGGLPWSRPMLRFYVTAGERTDQQDVKHKTLSAGAMFEAWW